MPVVRGVDMRKVIADAATRRNSITEGCASGRTEAGKLNQDAQQGGFRTKAEEDDANDRAIARALQELMEEEELQRLEQLCAPSPSGGLSWDRENGLSFGEDPPVRNSSSDLGWAKEKGLGLSFGEDTGNVKPLSRPAASQTGSQGRPLSRLVSEALNSKSKSKARPPSRLISADEEALRSRNKELPPTPPVAPPPPVSTDPSKWACPQCTLLNPLEYLACDACGLEQPPQPIPHHKRYGPSTLPSNLPKPPPASALRGPEATPFEPAKGRIGWNCLNCGTFMENQWWTCSLCGAMKTDS
jgi:DNA-dependent metalloprotease WSS1